MNSLAVSSSRVREGRQGQGGRDCHHCRVGRVIVIACKEGRARRRCVQREVGEVDEDECGRCRLVLAYDSAGEARYPSCDPWGLPGPVVYVRHGRGDTPVFRHWRALVQMWLELELLILLRILFHGCQPHCNLIIVTVLNVISSSLVAYISLFNSFRSP